MSEKLSIDLPAVVDRNSNNGQLVILNVCKNAVITNSIRPIAIQSACQCFSKLSWIVAWQKTFVKKAQNSFLNLTIKLFQLPFRIGEKFNLPSHLYQTLAFSLLLPKNTLPRFRFSLAPHNPQWWQTVLHLRPNKPLKLLLHKSSLVYGFFEPIDQVSDQEPQEGAHLTSLYLTPFKNDPTYKYSMFYMFYKPFFFIFLFLVMIQPMYSTCVGRFVNPITDVCWKCVFPITIMGLDVMRGNPSPQAPRTPICVCNRPPLNIPVPGIPVGFWEPVRLVDVTRTPYCLVNMGGISVASSGVNYRGDVEENTDDGTHHSFYQVHWYVYPIMYWLEVLTDFVCLENMSIDLAYLTELDPLWNDDEKSFILNPEAVLFGNIIAQAACAADCLASSVNLPLNELFWCSGCQGGLYPFTGTLNDHSGGVQASLLITARFMAKLLLRQ